jgi:hypothetical protein
MRFSRLTRPTVGTVLALAACASLMATVATRAQRGGGGAAGPPTVPLTASSYLLHPELYLGQQVSMMGTVGRTITKTTFTMAQGKTAMKGDVLVVAPTLIEQPDANAYITVVGSAVKFDPADIARRFKDYTLDLPADMIEKYKGQPVVLATSVINNANADIAKRAPKPATPEEQALDNVMKQVNPTFTALRQSLDASAATTAKQHAGELKGFFTQTQAFFKGRGTADATGWAGDAIGLVDKIDAAAAAGKWDDAKASATTLNGLCGQCHTAHRERQDDGTYRVKG